MPSCLLEHAIVLHQTVLGPFLNMMGVSLRAEQPLKFKPVFASLVADALGMSLQFVKRSKIAHG